MRIDRYRSISKGYLVSVFDVIFQTQKYGDMRIHGMKLFQKNGKRWISFTTHTDEKDGKKQYFPNEALEEAKYMTEFSKDVLKAIDDSALENAKSEDANKSSQYKEQEIPF